MNTVITSFTEEGYQKYGKSFLETFKEYWPDNVNIVVYYEGDDPRPGWHFIEEVDGLVDWMDAISKFPMMRGLIGDGQYEIQVDAGMARKMFMQIYAATTYGGKVFWVDADVITHAKVPTDFLDSVLPDDKLCCFLGREGWTFPDYTESGFLGFNTEHPLTASFFGAYKTIFTSGLIFRLNGWHDCYGFDAARNSFKAQRDAFINLSAHLKPDSTNHPFVNCVLGKYMDHKKGNRKKDRTPVSDLVIQRNEPYWNRIIVPNQKVEAVCEDDAPRLIHGAGK